VLVGSTRASVFVLYESLVSGWPTSAEQGPGSPPLLVEWQVRLCHSHSVPATAQPALRMNWMMACVLMFRRFLLSAWRAAWHMRA
jgi:hypothetical protein